MNDKELVYSAIAALGPIVKINDNYKPSRVSYPIAAGHLKDLIRDVSAELTDEQKHCPYCHGGWDSSGLAEKDLLAGEYNDGNIFAVQIFEGKTLRLSDILNIVEEYEKINFCPMCGRKLSD